MRKGEILGLKWKDVDLENGRITLHRTKNGDRRVVPVKGLALTTLQNIAPTHKDDLNYLEKIIQISSRSGFRPLPSISVYAASKYALEGISETMAALLKPWNINVCLIEPGPVSTDLDFLSPYNSRLAKNEDPYYSIFEKAGLLDPFSPIAQHPNEIASIVKNAIEADKPLFRYQTTESIKKQAGLRLVDITGMSSIS